MPLAHQLKQVYGLLRIEVLSSSSHSRNTTRLRVRRKAHGEVEAFMEYDNERRMRSTIYDTPLNEFLRAYESNGASPSYPSVVAHVRGFNVQSSESQTDDRPLACLAE